MQRLTEFFLSDSSWLIDKIWPSLAYWSYLHIELRGTFVNKIHRQRYLSKEILFTLFDAIVESICDNGAPRAIGTSSSLCLSK